MRKHTLRQWASLAVLAIAAALAIRYGAIVRAQSVTSPPLILVPGETNGIVLAPGTSATLPVSVTDAQGNPLAGATVLFVAPDHGASGAFANGDPSDSTVLRVATGSDGS